VAIRYATGRREPKEDIAEEFLSDSFWPICSPQLLPPAGRLRSAGDLEKTSPCPFLLVAIRHSSTNVATMARARPTQVAQLARF
jgi:hypothetical protein